MSDWPIRTIGECAADEPYSTQIGPFGKALTPEAYVPIGNPLLRGVNVSGGGRFHDDDFVFINDADAERLAKFESFPGDVLLVHKGSLGHIGLMPSKRRFSRYIMGNSMLRVKCDPAKLLPEYLRYWLQSPDGQHYLLSRVSQVGVPQIQRPLNTLREAALPVPPIPDQEEIVGVLGSLDDKIEQNRRTGAKLEGLARGVFKAWFVDFEPVKAKAAGATAFPGMPPETFAALPTRLTDFPLGPVPEGWEVGTMGDIGTQRREQIAPEDTDGDTPYIGLEHMPRRDIALSDWGTAASVTSSKFRFRRADILFGKLRPYFHKVGRGAIDGVCSTDIVVLHPKKPEYAAWLLMLVSSDEFVAHTDRSSAGTKMPRTNWKDMAAFKTTLPPSRVVLAFQEQIGAMLDLITASVDESRRLATLRDYLLPRLLSGRVQVLGRSF